VLVDWLPWSHVFGGNHNFDFVLRFGGSLYIDDGKPVPGLLEKTVRNLTEIAPTIYLGVPLSFAALTSALRDDAALRRNFFSRLQIILYAGAALPQATWEELERLAVMELGHPVTMLSTWGSTETAPTATDCHFQASRSGNIGVPVPGTVLKLVPAGGKLEVRVKGPNVFPGYWKQPELTRSAFDDEGFYRIGDAVEFVDPGASGAGPAVRWPRRRGLQAAHRHLGACRQPARGRHQRALARGAGHRGHRPRPRRDRLPGLPNLAESRRIAGLGEDAPVDAVLGHPVVRERVREGLVRMKHEGGGSSTYPARAMLLAEPPSMEAGELTEKGYINQRAVLDRRADRLLELYSDVPDSSVIVLR